VILTAVASAYTILKLNIKQKFSDQIKLVHWMFYSVACTI
jgi:hypothetical protein